MANFTKYNEENESKLVYFDTSAKSSPYSGSF